MTREQVQKIAGIIITAALAIAAVLGWFFPVEAPEERAVRERIAIDAREDVYLYNGADLYVYSDDHSTQKYHVDGATGNLDGEGTLTVLGAVTLDSTLDVDGNITSGTGSITVTDSINVTSTVDFDSTLNVDGAVTFNSTLDVDGNITSGTGSITVTDSLNVTGTVDFDSTLDMSNNAISNIGAAGTDFGSDGSLTTAQTITVTTGGLVVSAGGATVTAGGLTLSDGDAVIADDLRVTAQGAATVTQSGTITPTGTYQPITAAGAVSFSSIAGGTAGNLLVLINTSANAITITDTGTIMLSGNIALGQYDSLTLWNDGTNWIQIATTNN
jgi:hypothetical protein